MKYLLITEKAYPVNANCGKLCKSDGRPYAFFVAANLQFSMAVNNLLSNLGRQRSNKRTPKNRKTSLSDKT